MTGGDDQRGAGPRMALDHLIVACGGLADGAARAEEALGVPLAPGGRHERFGTANRLLSLGPGLYLEVIAPDPEAPAPAVPRWFGLDDAPSPARLSAWVARVPDLDAALAAAPPEAGEALALGRGAFRWRAAVPPDGSRPWGGEFPMLIAWEPGTHPADRLPDHGVRLLDLEVAHPRAPRLRALLAPLADPRLRIVAADAPGLRARLSTPRGEAWL